MRRLSDVQRCELLRLFGELNADIAEKRLVEGLISPEQRKRVEEATIFDLSHGNSARAKAIREHIGDPSRASVWGGKYACRLKELLEVEVLRVLESTRADIHRRVCVDFEYCHKRAKGTLESEGTTLTLAVADVLATYLTSVPLIASGTAYLVKKQILDRWCECKNADVAAQQAAAPDGRDREEL